MPKASVPDVTVGVDQKHNLTCEPAVLRARQGQAIVFGSANVFAFQAKGISPLTQSTFGGQAGTTVTVNVRPDAAPGAYSFACAVTDEEGQIHMDASCPSIII